jgi:hypothetical protein
MSKERIVNAGWTIGSVIVAIALYDIIVSPIIKKVMPTVTP